MASKVRAVEKKPTLVDPPSESQQAVVIKQKYVNGTHFPIKELREAQQNTECNGNIAAIDFGTTSCSLAYSVAGDTKIRFLRLDEADKERVPTTILLDANGRVVDFGSNARRKFAQLSKEKKQYHHYFSEIKTTLQHDKVLSVLNCLF